MKLETKIFPISYLAHFNKLLLEKELNLFDEANETANRLVWIIKLKNLTPKDVEKIRRNPEWDGRYHKLRENN